jgi:hypothetical protein
MGSRHRPHIGFLGLRRHTITQPEGHFSTTPRGVIETKLQCRASYVEIQPDFTG